ncbi:hypothetical protein [Micromonospora sp. KC606]|nr:hypothetical protein [Micromonospora sp. KC606]
MRPDQTYAPVELTAGQPADDAPRYSVLSYLNSGRLQPQAPFNVEEPG